MSCNSTQLTWTDRAKSFSLVFSIHFPERQFKVRKPNAFSQPVTTNRPAFLPAAAASQIYLPVLWKWPWLLDIHAAGSQRGREGGRSPFPGLQEVTLLLFLKKRKKQVYPRKPLATHVREPSTHTHTESVSHGGENTYDTRSLGSARGRNNSKIRKDQLLQGKWESLVRNVSRNDSRTDEEMVILPVSLKGNREEKDCVCREVWIVHDSECMTSVRICKCGDDTKCECMCVCVCNLCVIYFELSGHGFR